ACDEVIHDLVRIGRHETGLTSFSLNESHVFDLASARDLSIHDAETGFLIYRRNLPDTYLQKRFFRLETTQAVASAYAPALLPYFAYGMPDVQLYGHETISQLFNLPQYASMFFEGRVHITAHLKYLNDQFLSAVSVVDPFVALAFSIDFLGHDDHLVLRQLEEREYGTLLPLAGFFDGVALNQPEAVRKHMKAAPQDILMGLESPLVGLLTGHTPGVGGARGAIPKALDTLSMFDMVLFGHDTTGSHRLLASALGVHETLLPQIIVPPHVQAIADALRDVPVLEAALENDLIVYHCLEQAADAALP
ncbi:MAG: hypothetical protein AAF231_15705, partial [Pseudomonadota bacterium]